MLSQLRAAWQSLTRTIRASIWTVLHFGQIRRTFDKPHICAITLKSKHRGRERWHIHLPRFCMLHKAVIEFASEKDARLRAERKFSPGPGGHALTQFEELALSRVQAGDDEGGGLIQAREVLLELEPELREQIEEDRSMDQYRKAHPRDDH